VTQVAQLLIPVLTADADGRFGAARARADEALALGVGGFLLYGGDQESVRALAKELQQRSRTPLLIGADLERGAGQQFAGATGLPPLAAVAWLGDVEALRRAARLTAREARTMGVNWNLSPVCDLDLGAPSPVLGTRALGSDPAAVARLAGAWIEACQAEGVLACAKHFPGLGRVTEDPHLGRVEVRAPRDVLHAEDLAPFRAAFAANVASVMTAHVAYPALDPGGAPATLSREMITWLLRQQLRYDGLVVTDALDMRGVLDATGGEGDAAVRAIAAGCDVVLAPGDVAGTAAELERALASHALDPVRVQQSARRRLKWAQWASPPNDWRRPAATDLMWGAQLADRVVHVAQGELPAVGERLDVVVVDDAAHGARHEVLGRAAARADDRSALFDSLRTAGVDARQVDGPAAGRGGPLAVALFGGDGLAGPVLGGRAGAHPRRAGGRRSRRPARRAAPLRPPARRPRGGRGGRGVRVVRRPRHAAGGGAVAGRARRRRSAGQQPPEVERGHARREHAERRVDQPHPPPPLGELHGRHARRDGHGLGRGDRRRRRGPQGTRQGERRLRGAGRGGRPGRGRHGEGVAPHDVLLRPGIGQRLAGEPRGHHRDVVRAAGVVGVVHEGVAERVHVRGRRGVPGDLRRPHLPREPVAAEQQQVAAPQRLPRDVDLDRGVGAERLEDDVAPRARLGLLRRQLPRVDQPLDEGLVLGELVGGAVAHEVRAAVAHLREVEGRAEQRRGGERGAHPPQVGALGGRPVDAGVRGEHGVAEGGGEARGLGRGVGQRGPERFERGVGGQVTRHLAGRRAAQAVGDEEERAAGRVEFVRRGAAALERDGSASAKSATR
jgi:beta-glucosidase